MKVNDLVLVSGHVVCLANCRNFYESMGLEGDGVQSFKVYQNGGHGNISPYSNPCFGGA